MILKPCPHCHKTEEDKSSDGAMRAVEARNYGGEKACVIQCNRCGLSGPIFETVAEAMAAWNGLERREVEQQTNQPTQ